MDKNRGRVKSCDKAGIVRTLKMCANVARAPIVKLCFGTFPCWIVKLLFVPGIIRLLLRWYRADRYVSLHVRSHSINAVQQFLSSLADPCLFHSHFLNDCCATSSLSTIGHAAYDSGKHQSKTLYIIFLVQEFWRLIFSISRNFVMPRKKNS